MRETGVQAGTLGWIFLVIKRIEPYAICHLIMMLEFIKHDPGEGLTRNTHATKCAPGKYMLNHV